MSLATDRSGIDNPEQAAGAAAARSARRSRGARFPLVIAVLLSLLSAGCRPENKHYSTVSILCADAMRIHMKGQNVAQILRFSEREDGLRTQILFEIKDLDDNIQRAAATCAFRRDDQNRMILVGAALDGRALDTRELSELSDLLLRGTR